uniref:CCHC-type domain-containing protein n=1 Tax=Trichuris muris TaxID=70415 RepID=A0A5S6QG22_TRIMR
MRRKLGVVETAKDMWNKLVSIHEQSSGYRLDRLSTEFFSARKDPNVSYLEYIVTLQRTFHQLCEETKKQLGFEIPEKELLLRITSTIPPEHKTVRQIWDATPPAERNLSDLIERLQMAEEIDKSEKDNAAAFSVKCATDVKKGLSNATGKRSFPFKCRKCGKRGHIAANCRSAEKGNTNSTTGFIASVFTSVSHHLSSDEWIYDSGATVHMTRHRLFFSTYEPFAAPSAVNIGDGRTIKAIGKGTITIEVRIGRKWLENHLLDVLHVPDIGMNLFSKTASVKRGCNWSQVGTSLRCKRGGKIVITGHCRDDGL